jgi:hypothetical protein
MYAFKPAKRIAVNGTGLIGAIWMTLFLAKVRRVTATDPSPNPEVSFPVW